MSVLSGKHILLGVTAGIAAYKIAHLTRLFIKAGAEVRVIMTPKATEFITPLTLSTLSKNPVYLSFTKGEKGAEVWNSHVELGLWADYMIIAPATANTLSKMASGESDNLLVATYLSARCPVFIAPAMDLDMYKHPATVENLRKLESFDKHHIIPAETGELASGLHGEGRMAEPEHIVAAIEDFLLQSSPLFGKKILITAGPTYEPIDPVRYIGNRSSGKMGFALAEEAAELGAEVYLVTGPTHLPDPKGKIHRIDVETAEQMYQNTLKYYPSVDIAIAAAAVADYTPENVADKKIKKAGDNLLIRLKPTKDILKEMGKRKKDQLLVGFALETHDETANAQSKIQKKNLDFIVLNSLNDAGAGFATSTNKVSIIDKHFNKKEYPLQSKRKVAKDIFKYILEHHA